MKIGYFMDTVIPSTRANTVHVMKMCQAFSKQGHDITLICDKETNTALPSTVWDQYGISCKFNVKQIYLPKLIQKHGHRFGIMLSAKMKSKYADEFEVVYGRSLYSLYYMRNKKHFIYESHTEPIRFHFKLERKILSHKNCVGLVVISQALKDRYLQIFPFLKEDQITVLHDCADVVPLDGNKATLLSHDTPHGVNIGYLGHLYPGKCMEIMLPLAKRCPEYTFHIVGGTREWIDHWKNEAEKEEIRNVIFYGFVENGKSGDYYRAFDICVLPFSSEVYVDKRKSFNIGQWISPLKLFESMAYGKAILVSRIPTIEEVIENDVDGMLADPDNINEWVVKLTELVENESKRKSLGIAAREKMETEYTWDKRAYRIVNIFKKTKG